MYDRNTNTYWTQIDRKAILGPLEGQELEEVSIDTVVWRDILAANITGKVLSQDTGHDRNYGEDPYGSYYENSFVMFPVQNEDKSVHPKTVIYGIEVNGVHKAYKDEDLKVGTLEDTVDGIPITVTKDEVGRVTIINQDTEEEIVKERDFWFAWYAFHPDTLLYE